MSIFSKHSIGLLTTIAGVAVIGCAQANYQSQSLNQYPSSSTYQNPGYQSQNSNTYPTSTYPNSSYQTQDSNTYPGPSSTYQNPNYQGQDPNYYPNRNSNSYQYENQGSRGPYYQYQNNSPRSYTSDAYDANGNKVTVVSDSKDRPFAQDTAATAADAQLNKRIRDKISKGWLWDSYKEVILNTANGVVTLNGTVDSVDDQKKLVNEIPKIEGVRSVISQLRIKDRTNY